MVQVIDAVQISIFHMASKHCFELTDIEHGVSDAAEPSAYEVQDRV